MNFRLTAFISVSCLVHAGLLWSGRGPTPVVPIGGEASSIRITLMPPENSPRNHQPAPVPARPAPASVATRETPATVAGANRTVAHAAITVAPAASKPPQREQPPSPEQAAQPPLSRKQVTAAEATSAPMQSSSLNVNERVSAALRDQLDEVFAYPWLARKRGWQGSVMLSLHVDRNGALSGWKVVRTSGYRLLDRSALQAARRIRQLQRAESLLNGRPLNLSIPVHYQLLDG